MRRCALRHPYRDVFCATLLPRRYMLSESCAWFSDLVAWCSFVRWTLWNTLCECCRSCCAAAAWLQHAVVHERAAVTFEAEVDAAPQAATA